MSRAALLVATDLDGTLLDENSYSHEPAREALALLAERTVPLVLCSSKTRAELEALVQELDYRAPLALVVENGGALIVPAATVASPPGAARREGEQLILELGAPRERLVASLAALAAETGARPRGFASLTLEEIAALTGLGTERARLAQQRLYDEPYLLEDAEAARRLGAAAERAGLRVTRGGRFFHLTGAADKGLALRRLLELWRLPRRGSIGLGDSPNDLPLLEAVERPILVPRPDGRVNPALAAALPRAEHAPHPGPRGWNAALLTVLRGTPLPEAAVAARRAEPA